LLSRQNPVLASEHDAMLAALGSELDGLVQQATGAAAVRGAPRCKLGCSRANTRTALGAATL